MENLLPKQVKDVNHFTHWCNRIVDWCKRNTIRSSSDILVNNTTNGITLTLANKPVGRKSSVSATGMVYRGIYVVGNTYQNQEVVVLAGGSSAGSYVSVIPNNTNVPSTGIGWVQLSYGASNNLGSWI
jgi:hypothetical protein